MYYLPLKEPLVPLNFPVVWQQLQESQTNMGANESHTLEQGPPVRQRHFVEHWEHHPYNNATVVSQRTL